MEAHERAVRMVSDRVRIFHKKGKPFRVYHGSTNSTRKSQYSLSNTVDISHLGNVLKIDVQSKTALVEPTVPMDRLLEATLACGLMPPVVMEFPGISVGGGFCGTSAETFRFGSFDQSVVSIEMVLGGGTVVIASHDRHRDLFLGAASAFGTLGIVTLVELRLMDAQPYVALTYHSISSFSEGLSLFEKLQTDPSVDYLDGILYSKETGVIVAGRLTSDVGSLRPQGFTAPSDPWVYVHAKKQMEQRVVPTGVTPIVDYLFRYDRGGFWVGKVLCDPDIAVPYSTATKLVDFLDGNFGHYPLWLCPLRLEGESPMSLRNTSFDSTTGQSPSSIFLNFGVWGPGPNERDSFVSFNRQLERQVHQLGGKKWSYAHAYYNEDEFWATYDRKNYDALRQKYSADYLPTVYDKVRVDVAAERRANQESWIAWLLAIIWCIWPLAGYVVYRTLWFAETT